ncbi:protein of unknown function [Bradyrhizobium erythrophlei]|nr:protein of unknown function [Bradyrhizobium erythrophlei]
MNDIARMINDLQTAAMTPLDLADHYWIVGGATDQVYSSKTNTYVPLDDPAYVQFLADGKYPSPIAVEADIWPCQADIKPAWLFNGTSFAQPAVGAWTKTQLHAYQVMSRYDAEQGGMVLTSGMPILTNDRSQAKISGARQAAEKDSAFTTQWHAADGTFYSLASADVIAMSDELQTHIDNCFSTSATVAADIEAGTTTTTDQIDAAFAAVVAAAKK